jgi:gliding motility-associated-like protein
VIIDVYEIPNPYFNNDNITSCSESVEINVNPGNQSENYNWRYEGNTGYLFPDNEATTIFTAPPSDEIHTLFFTQTNGKNGECSTEISINVTILGSPSGNISTTDTEICGSGDIILTFNFEETVKPNLPFKIKYTDGTIIFEKEDISALVTHLTQNVTGNRVFTLYSIEDINNCFATEEDMTGVAGVTDIKPYPYFVNDEISSCSESVAISAITGSHGEIYHWQIIGDCDECSLYPDNTATTTFTAPVSEEVYSLLFIQTKGECATEIPINIRILGIPFVNAGNDTIIYGNKITLAANPPQAGESGYWSASDEKITSIDSYNSEFSNNEYGKFILTWTIYVTDKEECSNSDNITVTFLLKGRCYTAFSPNDDGKNDRFVIEGADQIKNNTLIVFDKNGKVVYKRNNYGADGNYWDGKHKGKPLPDGIYNYVFLGDDFKTVKNFLVIKRK